MIPLKCHGLALNQNQDGINIEADGVGRNKNPQNPFEPAARKDALQKNRDRGFARGE
jgi:hypothetical protein